MSNIDVAIRPMFKEDEPFILSSWLKSYRHGSFFAKRIRDHIFYKYHHAMATAILHRPSASVYVAADPQDLGVIFGYLVVEKFGEKSVFHFAYVKAPFRRFGIATKLLAASEIDPNQAYASHQTVDSEFILTKFPDLTYCPYAV